MDQVHSMAFGKVGLPPLGKLWQNKNAGARCWLPSYYILCRFVNPALWRPASSHLDLDALAVIRNNAVIHV